MQAKVTWRGGMEFEGTADSGHTLTLDAAPEVGGADKGFRPMELMAISLAGCTAMDVISILRKKRQEVTGFEVKVNAERATEHPHVFTAMEVTYVVRGRNIDPAAVERAIQLSEEKYCPAQAMLRKAAPITLKYEIVEEA
ncbi:OsmC family protein [Caldilinea sp.]|jgi:putative redox protein|uniref:OsmC family peroxiredoxin n=1 Tax=Caldilinea aerophila TaxID=133453 RepID=A0A7C1JJY3_9CHLR|nr:OsmC family protein [Caldilinea sp.]MBO9393762.1 OsmC family protein [Caldilinea sp.]